MSEMSEVEVEAEVERLRSENACLRAALEQEKAFRLYGWTKFDPGVTDRALALEVKP